MAQIQRIKSRDFQGNSRKGQPHRLLGKTMLGELNFDLPFHRFGAAKEVNCAFFVQLPIQTGSPITERRLEPWAERTVGGAEFLPLPGIDFKTDPVVMLQRRVDKLVLHSLRTQVDKLAMPTSG